jgi:hypothetical protein
MDQPGFFRVKPTRFPTSRTAPFSVPERGFLDKSKFFFMPVAGYVILPAGGIP